MGLDDAVDRHGQDDGDPRDALAMPSHAVNDTYLSRVLNEDGLLGPDEVAAAMAEVRAITPAMPLPPGRRLHLTSLAW